MSKISTEDLESLSNADLRARCIKYGLPNVPITDTSRKLLIRRLQAAIEGGEAKSASKVKSRRETINVVAKVVEPEKEASPKKTRPPSSRRTIAASNSSSAEPVQVEKAPIVELSVSSIPQPRRSGRYTPVPQPEPVITASTVKRKATTIDEESEDDNDIEFVPLIAHQYDGPQISRSSRSPSLSKSKMVSTSYQHVISSEPIQEEPVYSLPREVIIPVRREKVYQPPNLSMPLKERETASYLPRPSVGQMARTSITGNSNYSAHSSNTATTTRSYTTSGYKPPTEYNTGSQSYESPIKYTSSTLGYRPRPSEYHHGSDNSDDNEGNDAHADTPYLSDFARRLSRLKAEPLKSNVPGSMRKEGSQLRDSKSYYTTSIGGRRSISQNDSLGEYFRHFWLAIDRQYGLRKYLALIAIILVVMFIYIIFIQQN